MEDYLYNILADSTQTDGLLEGTRIRLLAKNPFARQMLDSSEVKKAVAETASALAGGTFAVTVEEYTESAPVQLNKLDRLMSKFDIKFDEEGE